MPGRHSPPPVVDTPATEKLKRPKKDGSAKKGEGTLQHPLFEGIDTFPVQTAPSQLPPLPDNLNRPDTAPPPPEPSTGTISSSELPAGDADAASSVTESQPRPGIIKVGGIEFHHESEAEFASLLNYYGIEWLYEPHQFPLQWRDGKPVEMFSPDFYLVEYDFYIELTTMRQALVRKKNRKLRLLRALYPEINIKLIYRRDYHRILERFGIKTAESEAGPGKAGENE